MFWRRRHRVEGSAEAADAFAGFARTLRSVEGAKRSLAAAAPARRGPGLPLAEALAGFEEGLREADAGMESWRRPEVEEQWTACRDGLAEAARRAERLRLGADPEGYEQLYAELGSLMEPLEVFAVAADRFRERRR